MLSLKKVFFRNKRLRGMLRLFGFFLSVSLVTSFFCIRSARAKVEGQMQNIGRRLLDNLGAVVIGEPQQLEFNGQRVFVASNATSLSPREVMDRFERYCRANSGGLKEAVGQLPSTFHGVKIPEPLRDPSGWMTNRSDPADDDLQQITCFVRSDQTTLQGYLENLDKFLQSGDVTQIGNMRFAVARRQAKSTQVLAVWTEGKFNLFDMFPENGDAPGSDLPEAPRPPNAQRLLTAAIPGRAHSFRVYESSEAPGRVLAYYDGVMNGRGYTPLPVWSEADSDEHTTALPSYARAFTKNDELIVISALPEPVFEKGTQVSVVRMAGRRAEAVVSN